MNSLLAFWNSIALPRKIAIAAASSFVLATFLLISQISFGARTGLLYSGLDPAAAGEVVAALEARGVTYNVDGNSIYVNQSDRDRLRMELAAIGLPEIGEKGYELLDNLSGFGTTSQMFDAAYWRAKEGELARTITAAPHIKTARVHIAGGPARPFQRDSGASASVTVGTLSGTLSTEQARALRFLVAAAVTGMTPNDVSVIDKIGGLIASGEDRANASGDDPRVESMKAKVERLLAARVGLGNAVVELSIESVQTTERITEHVIDPESRVAVSSEVEERKSSNENGEGGAVTVASNLPDGEASGSGASSSQSNETRERTNFELSETQREITRGPGDIRRLSVAVLVNHVGAVDDTGATASQPRSAAEMEVLRGLVASAVGFDEARGDIITIETLPFESVPADGTNALPGASIWAKLDVMQMVQFALGLLTLIAFGLFVLRPILKSGAQPVQADLAGLEAPDAFNDAPTPALEAEDSDFPELDFSPPAELPDFGIATNFDDPMGAASDDPAERLRSLINERQAETLQVLQSWIEQSRDTTKETVQ